MSAAGLSPHPPVHPSEAAATAGGNEPVEFGGGAIRRELRLRWDRELASTASMGGSPPRNVRGI